MHRCGGVPHADPGDFPRAAHAPGASGGLVGKWE
jgi:hypothetical protein